MKNGTEVTLHFSSNVICNSNDESNLPHKLLLSNTKIYWLRKAFASNSSANVKLSKTQLSKMVQSGGFVGFSFMDPFGMTHPTPKLTK